LTRSNVIVSLFGRKGTGKTTLAKFLTRNCKRLIIVDSLREYETGEVIYYMSDLYNKVATSPDFRIVFRPIETGAFDWVCYLSLALCETSGPITLLIDEIDNYANSYYISEPLRYIVHYGRHFNLSLITTARQANRVRNDITAQSDIIITFQQQGRQSISYIDDFYDGDNIEIVKNLKNFNYIYLKSDEKNLAKLSILP
jgi:hypothetical protein